LNDDAIARKTATGAPEVPQTEMQAINERLLVAGVQQQELAARAALAERRAKAALTVMLATLRECRALRERALAAQEEERRQISRELHDRTGQHLAGLVLGLQALEESISAYCPSESGANEKLLRLSSIAEDLARDIHRIAVELRPTALDDLGLAPSLETLVEQWSEISGIPAEFETSGLTDSDARLPEIVETAVYRVVQEALTNITRHAGDGPNRASRVSVTLQRFDDRLQVTVDDNGPGFDVAATRKSGRLGLAGMRERALSCGGTLAIESEPGQGTTVYLRIPLTAPPSATPPPAITAAL
jgi:signal transduction histidine kinase